MKAATSVPTGDASAVFHPPSDVLQVSRTHGHAKVFKLTDSWRICQEQSDPRRFSKATHPPYQTG